ncbi:MAG: CoA-transferase [Chloroflexota bacterium]|nr:CoA-transferase [Chloroflexota bacterium]
MAEKDFKTRLDKLMTEKEAVATFLHDGDSFTLGGALASRRCFSVAREMIRQKKRDLTFVDTAAGVETTMMVAGGCISKLRLGYFLMRTAGVKIDDTILRAMRDGVPNPLEVEDFTQYQLAMGFMAASMDIPYMVTKSGLGADYLKYNKTIKMANDPFENKPIIMVPAISPDVGFFCVQRADRRGNAQVFGDIWADDVKSRACKHVVIITEELVSTEVIQKYPANTLIPSYCVDAVVEVPFNCHPMSCYGCYGGYFADYTSFIQFVLAFGTYEGALRWLDEWVYGTEDQFEYCEKVGWRNLMRLVKMERSINRLPE